MACTPADRAAIECARKKLGKKTTAATIRAAIATVLAAENCLKNPEEDP
jgi:hypothetical protein